MRDLLLNPDKFFKENANKPANIKILAIVVLIQSIIASLILSLQIVYIPNILKTEMLLFFVTLTTLVMVLTFIVTMALLVVVGILSHIILTKMLDGEGDFKKMLEILGYSEIVYIFQLFFTLVVEIIVLQTFTPYWVMNDIFDLTLVIFALWAMLLFAKGVQYSYKLPFKKSLIVPFILFLLTVAFIALDYITPPVFSILFINYSLSSISVIDKKG